MSDAAALTVFISSPCYDLVDLRYELKRHLDDQGYLVLLSEDPSSAFYVDPLQNSIASCLANVEQSNVVICVIDRSYGPPLPAEYNGKSATHLEVEHARALERPVFFFVRDQAWLDFTQLKRNASADVPWVEKHHAARRSAWVDFVRQCTEFHSADKHSNWCDQFRSSVDLKRLVDARLLATFPRRSVSRALSPDRLVRLNFVLTQQTIRDSVLGHFRNSTPNTAFELRHGWRLGQDNSEPVGLRGALAEKENLMADGGSNARYEIPVAWDGLYRAVFCDYENTYGDRYRTELPFDVESEELSANVIPANARSTSNVPLGIARQLVLRSKRERFFVLGGASAEPKWIEVNAAYSDIKYEVALPDPN